jgi:iron complex outermembrane receptor protein
VSKRPESLSSAASSIFVITGTDIHRSGATTLPEALRLAPNLEVARVDARNYAVTSRGFSSPFENKLLVLIDGRTVYSPLFSGVYWDVQDVVLEDVERIEVISGPGATMWGANAVNGVINIITKSAAATQGTLLSATAGRDERNGAVRYGGALGNGGHYRVYAKYADNDDLRTRRAPPCHRLAPRAGGLPYRLGRCRPVASRCRATSSTAGCTRPARPTSRCAAPTCWDA